MIKYPEITEKRMVEVTKVVKPTIYECDHCKTEIEIHKGLKIDIFLEDEYDERHGCSWYCVMKIVPTVKDFKFMTLPHVNPKEIDQFNTL